MSRPDEDDALWERWLVEEEPPVITGPPARAELATGPRALPRKDAGDDELPN